MRKQLQREFKCDLNDFVFEVEVLLHQLTYKIHWMDGSCEGRETPVFLNEGFHFTVFLIKSSVDCKEV